MPFLGVPYRLAVLAPVVAIGLLFLAVALFQYLWNTTMPQLFNQRQVSYWQAFRLMLIAGLLFGSGRIIIQ